MLKSSSKSKGGQYPTAFKIKAIKRVERSKGYPNLRGNDLQIALGLSRRNRRKIESDKHVALAARSPSIMVANARAAIRPAVIERAGDARRRNACVLWFSMMMMMCWQDTGSGNEVRHLCTDRGDPARHGTVVRADI